MHLSLYLPETLSKRMQAQADAMGLTPELMAIFILARALHEEPAAPVDPRMVIFPFMRQPEQPTPPTTPVEETREEKLIAENQRMFAMNIASNLMAIGESNGKTSDEVWSKFDEFYLKVQDKMVKDKGVDGMIDGGAESK